MWMHLHQAVRVFHAGGVFAYPTEAVYGLGCDPLDEAAVQRLLAIKGRPVDKGLILLGANLEQLSPFIQLSTRDYQRLSNDWPIATTLLIEASPLTPPWIRGNHAKVAVRVSAHPVASALAKACGSPIVSTSANRSGLPACRHGFQVAKQLGDDIDFIVTGQCDVRARPSTIIDFDSGKVMRA